MVVSILYCKNIIIFYYFLQIEVLPEIVEAVKGYNVEVYLDGGVTSGNDVYKALALGARMVCKPTLHSQANTHN